MIDPRRPDGDEHRGRRGQRETRRAEHDGGKLGRRRHEARRDRGDPEQNIALAVLEHAADGPAVRIVIGRAAGIAHAERIAADPCAHGCRRDRALGAAERKPCETRGLIEVLHQAGELLDGELGMGKVERRRRPDHDAVFRLSAALGERIDIGKRHTATLGGRDPEAAQPRSEERHNVTGLPRRCKRA